MENIKEIIKALISINNFSFTDKVTQIMYLQKME